MVYCVDRTREWAAYSTLLRGFLTSYAGLSVSLSLAFPLSSDNALSRSGRAGTFAAPLKSQAKLAPIDKTRNKKRPRAYNTWEVKTRDASPPRRISLPKDAGIV